MTDQEVWLSYEFTYSYILYGKEHVHKAEFIAPTLEEALDGFRKYTGAIFSKYTLVSVILKDEMTEEEAHRRGDYARRLLEEENFWSEWRKGAK